MSTTATAASKPVIVAILVTLAVALTPVVLMVQIPGPAAAASAPPVADLVLNPPIGMAPHTVIADGSGSTDDVEVTSFAFDWGDGTRSPQDYEQTASHVYPRPGEYVVTLTVGDSEGNRATTSSTVTVAERGVRPANAPPVARLTASSAPGRGALGVEADAGASRDDRGIQQFVFDFGDGSRTRPQPQSTARHVYQEPGTYTVAVTTTDAAGLTSTATSTVSVTAAAEPVAGTAPTVVSFTFDDTFANQIPAADVLTQYGFKGTFYINSPRIGSSSTYMSRVQVDALGAAGHEVSGHTLGHVDLTTVSTTEQRRQVCDDRRALVDLGLQAASFAYPFGANNATVRDTVSSCPYAGARTVGGLRSPGYGCASCVTAETIPPVDPRSIRTNSSVKSDTTLDMLKTYVTQAESDRGGWVPLVFHSICSGCASNAIDLPTFRAFAEWLTTRPSSTTVKTVAGVIAPTTTPTSTPTATATPTPTATPTSTPTATPTTVPANPRSVTIAGQTRTLNGINVSRQSNYLVLYTPARGARTGTNQYGTEISVVNGAITQVQIGVGNMVIPPDGYVVSGHGTSNTWLRTHARVGGTVTLNP